MALAYALRRLGAVFTAYGLGRWSWRVVKQLLN